MYAFNDQQIDWEIDYRSSIMSGDELGSLWPGEHTIFVFESALSK